MSNLSLLLQYTIFIFTSRRC